MNRKTLKKKRFPAALAALTCLLFTFAAMEAAAQGEWTSVLTETFDTFPGDAWTLAAVDINADTGWVPVTDEYGVSAWPGGTISYTEEKPRDVRKTHLPLSYPV
ncbi:hypothetical protein QUF80_13990 [Desulfococcaceae bacterium HSG8]|nr:hypothetical protein [Desulfococcaceae bacterium HSG8]